MLAIKTLTLITMFRSRVYPARFREGRVPFERQQTPALVPLPASSLWGLPI